MNRWNDLQLEFKLEGLERLAEEAGEGAAISVEEAKAISAGALAALKARGAAEAPGWFGEFMELLELGWPWRVACYMAWASAPKTERWPETLEKLALNVLGLRGPRVIHTWRKNFPGIDAAVMMLQARPLWEHRREVFEALAAMAKQPDYKSHNDRKLFLEMTGDYVRKSEVALTEEGAGDVAERSDEELRRWAGVAGSESTLAAPTSKDEGGSEKDEK